MRCSSTLVLGADQTSTAMVPCGHQSRGACRVASAWLRPKASSVSTSLMEQRDCRLRASSAPGRSPAALSLVAHFPKLRARTESWPVIENDHSQPAAARAAMATASGGMPRSPGEAPAGILRNRNLRRSPTGARHCRARSPKQRAKVKRTQWHLDPGIKDARISKECYQKRAKSSPRSHGVPR